MALPKPPCPKCKGTMTLVHARDNTRRLECNDYKCFHSMDYDEWLRSFIEQLQKDLAFWKEEAQAEEKRANALKAQIKERADQPAHLRMK